MEVKNACQTDGHGGCQSNCGSVAPFFVGIVLALIAGWWLYPQLLFSQEKQPLRFSHVAHVDGAGMECQDCHFFNEDGSYNGIPTTESCAECHEEPQGEDPAELEFIKEYVAKGKEVPWHIYQMQPDNVFFSHAAHNLEKCTECHAELYETEAALCNECHPDVASSDTPPTYYENRLTTYSKQTMKMWECEECHALPDHQDSTIANNACFTCHK